jgi:membrane glycosyltransferase
VKRTVGIAAAALLIFDVAWPLIYRPFREGGDTPAVVLTIFSMAIPFVTALVLARDASIRKAVLAAGMLGALDSTVGWMISFNIAPDLQEGPVTVESVLLTIPAVVLLYAAAGFVGALIGRWFGRRREVQAP